MTIRRKRAGYYEVPIDGAERSGETAIRQLSQMSWISTFEAKQRAMRILKAIYLTALFTLATGLFCGELPESLRLDDDTTNDYVANSNSSIARESEAVRGETPAEKVATAGISQIELNSGNRSPLAPATASGKELLPLLSIRRT